MAVLPLASPTLVMRLLGDGIPPSLLCDLLDPVGMRVALASELALADLRRASAHTIPVRRARKLA